MEEEMFLILEGEGELRYGKERFPIRRHDVIACPTGDSSTAHQIINTGNETMLYLALSTLSDIEICDYPDSAKTGIFGKNADTKSTCEVFRSETMVDYYDREVP
jgi:uncharacterized cupin superfamily protein